MLQNEYNFVGYYSKYELLPKLKILMKTVTDGTRTDFVQFTQLGKPFFAHVTQINSQYFTKKRIKNLFSF